MAHRTTAKRSRFRLIGEIIAELRKVVWLSRREATYLTFLVLVVTIAVGAMLGAFDWGFTQIVDKFFLGG
ncbi:MAG TPA: preprotein translocase subunit SecE [Dehalococcoidales bacterium]|nr:preprotein translocase subunit SecE [Dehalococcoidales bacterium]